MNDEDMKDTDRICRDIEETRARIDRKFVAMKERMAPARIVPPLRRLQETIGAGGEGIVKSFRENPVPVALVGLGIGWLMLRDLTAEERRAATGSYPLEGTVGVESQPDAAGRIAGKAKAVASKAKGAVVDTARGASYWFSTTLSQNPLVIAIATLGAGLIAGLALPVSAKEAETVGKLGEKVVGAVLDKGKQAIEKEPESEVAYHEPAPPDVEGLEG